MAGQPASDAYPVMGTAYVDGGGGQVPDAVSVEPAGGSKQPTTTPIVTLQA